MELEILFYTIIFFFFGIILSLKIFSSKTETPVGSLPPSPKGLPIIGHLHLLNNTPHQSFHNLCTRYGPLIHLRLGSVLCVIASTPKLAKELLITKGVTFAARPVNIANHFLTYESAGFAFAPYGPFWKFMKKITTIELLGERTLTQLQYIRVEEAYQLIRLLWNKSNNGEIVNLSEEVMKLSNNIISRMLLNIRCSGEDEQAKEIRSLVRDVTEIIAQFNLSDFIWFLRKIDLQGIRKKSKNIQKRYDALLEKIMKEREEIRKKRKMGDGGGVDHQGKDFLDILLDKVEENEDPNIRLTRDNIKAFVFDFFIAGTDTSGIITEWAISELINHPTILERARKEIDSTVGKNRLVEESDISHLPYLQSILKETFRLHPPIPIFERESTQDCKIEGYEIPAKTILFINVWSICRDPKNWENPLEFQPERFMVQAEGDDNASTIDVRGQHYNLLPFGTGRRGCPGVSLAMQVVPRMLALLIQCFDWKVTSHDKETSGRTIDMSERPGLTVPKAHPLMLVPSARLNPFPIHL